MMEAPERRVVGIRMAKEHGAPGASTAREGGRRKSTREQRVRDRYPRSGGLRVALAEPPVHERVWARGAEGERLVAESLAKRCNGRVVLLHDRRVPGSRANVDHIAVTPSGVWVIDAKRHKGKVEVTAPLFGRPKLRIKGRDCSVLVTGVANQVELVSAALAAAPGVSVQGCMCFVEAELPLPLLGRPRIGGVVLHHRRSLARALNKNGPLSDRTIAELTEELLERFPSA